MRELKMKILQVIRKDEEVLQFRQEWKRRFTEPFLLWNYDCFGGIDDYKQRIRDALDSGNSKKICNTCAGKKCKAWNIL